MITKSLAQAQELDIISYEGGGVPVSELDRMMALYYLTVLPDMDAGLPTYLPSSTTSRNGWRMRMCAANGACD